MQHTGAVRTTVLGALAAAAALLLTAPSPLTSAHRLASAGSATQLTDPLVALLALLAWLGAAYLLGVTALAAGGRLPGAVGRALTAVVRRTAPASLRRALEVALGVTLVVGSLGGTAFAAGPAGAPSLDHPVASAAPASGASSPAAPASLDHPTAGPGTPVPLPTPSLDHPLSIPTRPGPTAGPSLDHPVSLERPATLDSPVTAARPAAPARPAGASADTPDGGTTAAEEVVVRPGDSLWSIAEGALGPGATDTQVAQAWPSWWQANREVVGDDPDLLHPGTPLVPPTDS